MSFPVQLTFRDFASSPWIEGRVREKALSLSRLSDRIIWCHVVLEERNHHHRKGELFHVRVELEVPGEGIVASREHPHSDLYAAIEAAFDACRRQLAERSARRRRLLRRQAATASLSL